MLRSRIRSLLLPIVYLSSAYQFVRYYVTFPTFYLRLSDYLSGHERLPFQTRILPIPFLRFIGENRLIERIAATRSGPLQNPNRIAFAILSAIALAVTWFFCIKLYRLLSPTRRLEFLLYPTLLLVLTWTYVIHIEQNFSYPYDMPSLAFFTAGLYFIYTRRFAPLALTLILGTFNRETTLFLIGLYLLDAASVPASSPSTSFGERFNLRQVPWARAALLLLLWAAIKVPIAYHFRANDRSEDHLRITENLIRLISPNYWPAALNLCGYLLPFVLILRNRLFPQRFRNYLYIFVPWFLIMFVQGILLETRLYGEMSCYIAIAMILIFEQWLESLIHPISSTGSPTLTPAP